MFDRKYAALVLSWVMLGACSEERERADASVNGGDAAQGNEDAAAQNGDSGENGMDAGTADAGAIDPMCRPALGMTEACGGDPAGQWTYRKACTDQDLYAAAKQACPGLMVSDEVTSSSGSLRLEANGTFTRQVDTVASATLQVPAICAQAIGGCPGMEVAIQSAVPGSRAVCSGAGDCDCDVTIDLTTDDVGTYTVQGGSITAIAPGGSSEYWFCVEGGVFSYRNKDSSEPFTYALTR